MAAGGVNGPFWRGLLAALVGFFVLIAGAALVIDAATSAITSRNRAFVLASLLAAVIAGFAGARFAFRAPRRARYAAAILGPTVISLVFAITSTADDQSARWLALVFSIAGSALGAVLQERVATAARRR